MNTGFYNAAVNMSTISVLDMEVHTENLANSNMPGYKRLESGHTAFSDVMDQQIASGGATGSSIVVNHSQGALRVTDRPLDFAIEGEGFFVVSDGSREFLTRNGNFRVASDGTVVNTLGMRVQTTVGDFRIPPGGSAQQLTLDDQLNLRMGNEVLGQLRLAAVDDTSRLEQAGTTLFVLSGAQEINSECKVVHGALEQSNTGIFEEMVGIMTTLRNYEACQKMLRTVDEAETQMMNKLV